MPFQRQGKKQAYLTQIDANPILFQDVSALVSGPSGCFATGHRSAVMAQEAISVTRFPIRFPCLQLRQQ